MFDPNNWSQFEAVMSVNTALTTNSAEGYNSAFVGRIIMTFFTLFFLYVI